MMSVTPGGARKTVAGAGCGEAADESERPEFGANARRTFSINKPRRMLDFSCGDPFYHIKQEHRATFSNRARPDPGLDHKVVATVDDLNQFPILKRNT